MKIEVNPITYPFNMNILDLFAGIGGFSLAAHWRGFQTVGFVEWEKFPQMVLKKNFPNIPIWSDIKDFNKQVYEKHYKGNAPKVDIITGGFPCQPFSGAGRRKGAKDDRFLWPEMLRIIEEFKPTWVIGENVAGILSMVQPEGEIKVEGSTTSLFAEDSQVYTEEYKFITESICQDFERIGYQVQPLLIPACAVGANHRRDRVWFVANANQTRLEKCRKQDKGRPRATVNGCDKSELSRQTVPPVCGTNDGIPVRLDGYKLTANQHREKRLNGLGNAIIPQVAYEIFKAIREI